MAIPSLSRKKTLASSRRAAAPRGQSSRPSHARHLGLSPAQTRLVVPFFALTLLLVGALTSVGLVLQSQDLRQQASTITMSHGGGPGKVLPEQPAAKLAPSMNSLIVDRDKCTLGTDGTRCVSKGGVSVVQHCLGALGSSKWADIETCHVGDTCISAGGGAIRCGAPQQSAPQDCDGGLKHGQSRCKGNERIVCSNGRIETTTCGSGYVCQTADAATARCVTDPAILQTCTGNKAVGSVECLNTTTIRACTLTGARADWKVTRVCSDSQICASTSATQASCVPKPPQAVSPPAAAPTSCADGTQINTSSCSAGGSSIRSCRLVSGEAVLNETSCGATGMCQLDSNGRATCVGRASVVPPVTPPRTGFLGLPVVPPVTQATGGAELTRNQVAELVTSGEIVGDGNSGVCYSWWGGNEVPSGYCDERFWDGRWLMQVCTNGIYDAPSRYSSDANYCTGRYLYPKRGVVENVVAVATQVTAPVQRVVSNTCRIMPPWAARAFGCQTDVRRSALESDPSLQAGVRADELDEQVADLSSEGLNLPPCSGYSVPNTITNQLDMYVSFNTEPNRCLRDGVEHVQCWPGYVVSVSPGSIILRHSCVRQDEYNFCSNLAVNGELRSVAPQSGSYRSCRLPGNDQPLQHFCTSGAPRNKQETNDPPGTYVCDESTESFVLPSPP